MKTIRCPECNLVNWVTAADCKRCRYVFQSAGNDVVETASISGFSLPQNNFQQQNNFPPPPIAHDFAFRETTVQPPRTNYQTPQTNYRPPQNNQAYNNYQPNYNFAPQPQNLKSGLAITSMVFGILAIVGSIIIIGIVFAPIGLILAIVALVKASKRPNEYGGKGFAVAGLVTSALVLLILPMIAAIAIPNLLAAARAANEGSAISTIRTIANAQGNSKFNGKQMNCATLQDLAKTQTINQGLADGEHNGYRFAITDLVSGGCEITATPLTERQGKRSFYYSTAEGKIRAATKQGAIATKNDPILD